MKKSGLVILGVIAALGVGDHLSGGWLRERLASAAGTVIGSSEAKFETPGAAGGRPGDGSGGSAKGGSRSAGGSGGRNSGPKPVITVAAELRDIAMRRRTIGSVTPQSALSVTSNVQGMLIERVAREGSDIKAGEVIARLDNRAALAAVARDRAVIDRDAATLTGAEDDLARQRKLATSNVATGQALQDAETAVATATATIALDKATLSADEVALGYMDIRAPITGRLGAYLVAVGNVVQPGDAVVQLTQMAPVDVSFSLAESDIAALRDATGRGDVGVEVTPTTTTSVSDGAEPGTVPTKAGTLSFIDSRIDPLSGTFAAKAVLPNADLALWPGQSVSVDVVLARRQLVAVPSMAVQPAQVGSIVYLVADGKVVVRPVTVGLVDGDVTGISQGLAAGDRVITEGQINLTDGMAVAETAAPAPGPAPAAPPASATGPGPLAARETAP